MTGSIRRAAAGDIAACAALYERVGRGHFIWKPDTTFRAADFAPIAAEEEVWLLERNGTLAAFLSYYVPAHFVHLLFIDEAHRRLRIGTRLLAHARDQYGVSHSLKVNEANTAARAFYARLGYTAVERGETDGSAWIRLNSP